MKLNPITLRFSAKQQHLEVDFLRNYLKNSLSHIRIALILGCILFAIFGVLDAILIPEKKHLIWAIRYGAICPTIIFVLFLSYVPKTQEWIQPILSALIVISGGGIIAMIIIAPPPVSYSYYAGLILIFIFGYTFIRVRFIWATLAGWIVVFLYEIAASFYQTPMPVLINNNFFFISANVIGMLACYSIEFYTRRAYYLNWLLIKEKEKVYTVNQELEKRVENRTKELINKTENLRREIDERKQVEEDLQTKNLVFESAITANSIANVEGLLTNINKTFLKIWGYEKKEDVLGEPIARFLKFEHEAKVIITSLDETGIWEGEYTALKRDGSTFSAYGLATTIKSLSEDITGYQSSVIDISDYKKAQKIAGENEKLALVGQIAGKMAHDFNNVLGIIMGHSELALLKYKELEIKNTFELIFNQTLRGKNLTKNLITFAKSAEPKQEFFSINEKIDFVLKLLEKDLDGIEIQKDELNKIEVLADPGMIEHSLVNLIQNSIHATGLIENPQIIIRIYCLKQTVVFEIEDNGCGIPEEHIDNIYEPSFSLKGSQDVHGRYRDEIKGTGYGMSNVKRYIELHNGNVLIESNIASGTKVTITLPMIEKELTKEEMLEIQRTKNYPGKYILLVEDEPAISDVQNQILTQPPNDHEVDIASNGQIAIEMLAKNQYDLISLDNMLPGKINGIDIYHHIRKTNTSLPILFISGNIEFLESIKMLKQKDPYLAHVSKPCMNIDYLNSINKLFESLTI